MATQKKSTKPATKTASKSTAAKPKTTVKSKTTAAKPRAAAPRKKPATKKQAVDQNVPFMTVRPTIETAYWLIFGAAILALGVWVLNLTIKINVIYDQIDMNEVTISSLEEMSERATATKAE